MKNHTPRVHLIVSVRAKEEFEFSVRKVAGQVARAVLKEEKCPYETEISLLLVGDTAIQEMNAAYREKDQVTDVLSFPNVDFDTPSDFSAVQLNEADYLDPDTGRLYLGDIVLNVTRVKEQASQYGHSELREYAFLIAHSMLHLCGYDHMIPEDAALMEARQKEILDGLGITRGLNATDDEIIVGEH